MHSISSLEIIWKAISLGTKLARNTTVSCIQILHSIDKIYSKNWLEIAMCGSAVCAFGYAVYNRCRREPLSLRRRNDLIRRRSTRLFTRVVLAHGIMCIIQLQAASIYWSFYDPEFSRLLIRSAILSSVVVSEMSGVDSNETSSNSILFEIANVGMCTYYAGLFIMLIPKRWDTGAILALIGSSPLFSSIERCEGSNTRRMGEDI